MSVTLTSLIEGYWRIFVLLLFVIGFKTFNVYVISYDAPNILLHFHLSILGLLYRGLYTDPHTYLGFLMHLHFMQYYICVQIAFLFSSWEFLSIN